MEIFNYFKQIYSGKNSLANHISLFSLAGIFVILFIKYTASWGNMLVYNNFYMSVPTNNYELWAYLFLGTLLVLYFIGYGLNIIHNVVSDKGAGLSEFTLLPFVLFVKTLPLMLYWIVYYTAIFIAGILFLLKFNNTGFCYIFASVMLCLIPFFIILFADFTRYFRYKKTYFNCFRLFRIVEKSLGEVIYLSIGVFIALAIPSFIIYKILVYPISENMLLGGLVIKLASLCLGLYIFIICNYVYSIGLADITKKRLLN